MHRFGLRLFGTAVWKLLIIEPFSQWKLNKVETELEFGGVHGVVGERGVVGECFGSQI